MSPENDFTPRLELFKLVYNENTEKEKKSTISQITIHKIHIEIVLNYAFNTGWLQQLMLYINKESTQP